MKNRGKTSYKVSETFITTHPINKMIYSKKYIEKIYASIFNLVD